MNHQQFLSSYNIFNFSCKSHSNSYD